MSERIRPRYSSPRYGDGNYWNYHPEYQLVCLSGNTIRDALAHRGTFLKLNDKNDLEFYKDGTLIETANKKQLAKAVGNFISLFRYEEAFETELRNLVLKFKEEM